MKENLQQTSEKKYRVAPRLYREFTDSFTVPFRRIIRLAQKEARIFKAYCRENVRGWK